MKSIPSSLLSGGCFAALSLFALSVLFSFVCFVAESCCAAAAGAPSSPGAGCCFRAFYSKFRSFATLDFSSHFHFLHECLTVSSFFSFFSLKNWSQIGHQIRLFLTPLPLPLLWFLVSYCSSSSSCLKIYHYCLKHLLCSCVLSERLSCVAYY